MAKKYLDDNGLLYFWQKIKSMFVSDVNYDTTNKKITKTKNGTTSDVVTVATIKTDLNIPTYENKTAARNGTAVSLVTTGEKYEWNYIAKYGLLCDGHDTLTYDLIDYSSDTLPGPNDATLLKSAARGAANGVAPLNASGKIDSTYLPSAQNAFSNVKVGSTTIAADSSTDTLELVAGSNVTLTPDATNDKVTIAATDTTYESKAAASGGTAVSLVTTGEKYRWEAIYGNALVGQSFTTTTCTVSNEYGSGEFEFELLRSAARGAANGVCPLNASSKIDSTYLPSYVDDVVEAYARSGQTALSQNWLATGSASGTVISPETGKIYVLMADSGNYTANTQFRWGGSAYVKLNDGGVTSITNAEIDTIVAA